METRKTKKHVGRRLIWHTEGVKDIMRLLADTRSLREVELIFDRILTTREINDMARRFKVLKMIDEGKSYADIVMETGMSSSVICRLSAKCGFGFQKSSDLMKTKKSKGPKKRIKLRYKGVSVIK